MTTQTESESHMENFCFENIHENIQMTKIE